MKYIYLVDYWVPFPTSEYGGIISVIAENDDECFDILAEASKDFDGVDIQKYQHLISPKVAKSIRFELANSEEDSGIVDAFTT